MKKLTKQMADKIDFEALEKIVEGIVGVRIKFACEYCSDKNGYVEITSQDLVGHIGIMKSVISKLCIVNFGYATLNSEGNFCANLYFHWEHVGPRSNGHSFGLFVWSFKNKKWL